MRRVRSGPARRGWPRARAQGRAVTLNTMASATAAGITDQTHGLPPTVLRHLGALGRVQLTDPSKPTGTVRVEDAELIAFPNPALRVEAWGCVC
jgi:hypothetical protein